VERTTDPTRQPGRLEQDRPDSGEPSGSDAAPANDSVQADSPAPLAAFGARPLGPPSLRTSEWPVGLPAGRTSRGDAEPSIREPVDHPETDQPPRRDAAPKKARRRVGLAGLLLAVGLISGLAGGLVGVMATREGGLRIGGRAGSRAATEAAAQQGTRAGDQLQQVLGAVLPAVVKVEARTDSGKATGSGVVFGKDGYVLTNAHVVDGARTIGVTLSTSEPLRARLIGRDLNNDLAVLKVRRAGLAVARFGRSGDLRVGDAAVVVGSPFGFQGSVTTGIVSALHRVVKVPDSGGGEQGRELVDAIQTDAAINPGNSGGALANANGQVVGISTAIATNGDAESNAGVGFAIPIDEALEVAKALVGRKPVRVPFLGVESDRELSPDDVDRYRLGKRAGALVSWVEPRSPAAGAGLRRGDLIVRFDDQPVRAGDQLAVALRQAEVGVPVPVTVVRRNRQLVLQVVPTDQPKR
jgi:putative serine protease PepD